MIRTAGFTLFILAALAGAAVGHNPAPLGAGTPEVPDTPGLLGEQAVWVRLEKLGVKVQELVQIGDHWQATVIKNGARTQLRFDAASGALQEVAPPRPR